jgi:hypothetical protein
VCVLMCHCNTASAEATPMSFGMVLTPMMMSVPCSQAQGSGQQHGGRPGPQQAHQVTRRVSQHWCVCLLTKFLSATNISRQHTGGHMAGEQTRSNRQLRPGRIHEARDGAPCYLVHWWHAHRFFFLNLGSLHA